MIAVKRSYLKRFVAASAIAGVIIAAAVSVASASAGVTITSPSLGDVDVYFDANGNGQHEANEFVGTFPAYPGSGMTFRWAPYDFPAGVNGAYFVSLWQNTTPLDKQNPTWVLRKAAHDFADNPAGTDYLMGPFFDYENICEYCPSIILVQLEGFEYAHDDVLYFPLVANLVTEAPQGSKPEGYATSDEFVLEGIPGKEHKPGGPACKSPKQSKYCCEKAGMVWIRDTCISQPE